ncbi:MAG: transporter substrate-binding domain-containing protein [Rhodoferax sp.]|nr:transporter substrate-binding domain-containing protein [Rhodoferax sp.]
MKKIRIAVLTAFTATVLLATSGALSQTKSKLNQILERGTLRVGTTGDFNPMSIKDTATNTLTGFDIEAMNQLATDMGVKVEYVPAEWATLVNGIVADRFDIFSGASISMARAKTVAFSDPYIFAGAVPLVSKKAAAKFPTWNSINQPTVTVAVLMGTTFEQQARSHFPKAKIRAVEKPATGYQEVLAGRAQITLTSNVEAATLMKTYPDLQMVGTSAEMRNKRPFAYPMPQGDDVWLTFVNNWIALKQAEGFFTALESKWLSAQK